MSERKTVLLVDDDNELAEALRAKLEESGFDVFAASNGRDALLWLGHVQPDVIVTDMMMPVMDGLDLLETLKCRQREEGAANVPTLAMSSLEPYLAAARALGASALLQKPFGLQEFVAKVNALASGAPVRAVPLPTAVAEREVRRIQAIIELGLDRPAGGMLQGFTEFVAQLFEVETCLITVITSDRQYWTAGCGIDPDLLQERGTHRSQSFCQHAVVAEAALVVQDAAENLCFKDNPFVTQRGIRFYAGVPVRNRIGEAVGTLCILDRNPKAFGKIDLELLSILSRRVGTELEWRERRLRPELPESAYRYLNYYDEKLGIAGREALMDIIEIESDYFGLKGRPLSLIVLEADRLPVAKVVERLKSRFKLAWIGRLDTDRLGITLPDFDAREAKAAIEASIGSGVKVEAAEIGQRPSGAKIILARLEAMFPPKRTRGASDEAVSA